MKMRSNDNSLPNMRSSSVGRDTRHLMGAFEILWQVSQLKLALTFPSYIGWSPEDESNQANCRAFRKQDRKIWDGA